MALTSGAGRTPEERDANFKGFSANNWPSDSDLANVLFKRRVNTLEDLVKELRDRLKSLEVENQKLKVMVLQVKRDNETLQSVV